ncbi:MAG: hypothetical protein FIA97_04980 [Methylococcaceae bacterium]|nr:hypothetical protein [Methylococcaceae bacterium]
MLLVMTLIGITGVQVTSLEEKMAGNSRDRNLAFQAAEAALRAAEGSIAMAVQNKQLSTFEAQFTGHPYYPKCTSTPGCSSVPSNLLSGDNFEGNTNWDHAVGYTGSLSGVSSVPHYVVEWLVSNDPKQHFYRITARGVGGSANAVVVLQSVYQVSEP